MDRGAWKAAVHRVPEGPIRLSDFTFTFHFHALEKEMATHSSVLAWRIPGMGDPGGLPSMGSHRVRHDWSDLAVNDQAAYRGCPSAWQLLIKWLTGANEVADRCWSTGSQVLIKLLRDASQVAGRRLSRGCVCVYQWAEWALVKGLTGTDLVVDQALNDYQSRNWSSRWQALISQLRVRHHVAE